MYYIVRYQHLIVNFNISGIVFLFVQRILRRNLRKMSRATRNDHDFCLNLKADYIDTAVTKIQPKFVYRASILCISCVLLKLRLFTHTYNVEVTYQLALIGLKPTSFLIT